MVKKFASVLVLLMLCASCAYADYTAKGYSGNSASDAYPIETIAELKQLAANASANKYYRLLNDIQLAGESDWPGIGTIDNPFCGHFDGQGFTIYVNIWPLSGNSANYTPILTDRALFGYINTASDYAVKNLKVEGSVSGYNAGGIVSVLEAGTIENCSFSGDVTAQTRNGDDLITYLIDELGDDDIEGVDDIEKFDHAVSSKVQHRGKINAGGIAAVIEDGDVIDCSFRGNVIAEANLTPANAGGIAGRMFDGNITGCYAAGDSVITSSTAETSSGVLASSGGIAGNTVTPLDSVIENCRVDGSINSTYYAGGIAGIVRGTILQNNTLSATATVSATYSAGGIAGYLASGGKIDNCTTELGSVITADTYSSGGIAGLVETNGQVITNNTSYAAIRGSASYQGGIVGALGNNTYSGIAVGSGNIYSGADYGIGRDEWNQATNGTASDGSDLITKSDNVLYSIITSNVPTIAAIGEMYTGLLDTTAPSSRAVTWSYSSTFPDWLAMDTSTGVITGTPSETGTYSFTVGANVSDYGELTSASINITVNETSSSGLDLDPATKSFTTRVWSNFSQVFTADTGITLSTNSTLPAGMSAYPSGSSLTISGTPTESGLYTIKITGTSGNEIVGSSTITLRVNPAIEIATTAINSGTQGAYMSRLIIAYVYYGSSISWEITDGSLPGGLALTFSSSSTSGYMREGRISGTPTASGSFDFTVSVSSVINSNLYSVSQDYTLYIEPSSELVIGTYELPDAALRREYSADIEADSPARWSITDGSLPEGLSLSTVDGKGRISGTPSESGEFTFTVQAVSDTQSGSKTFTLVVNDADFTITTTSTLRPGIAGTYYGREVLNTDAESSEPRVWYIDEGTLPTGLTLTRDTGIIYGTPTESGTYTFKVKLLIGDQIASKTFTITIIPGSSSGSDESMIILDPELPAIIKAGESLSINLHTDVDASESFWSIIEGTLPPGLELNSQTGEISGTPTRAGTFTFTVQNISGYSAAQKELTLIINFVISSDEEINFQAGEFCSYRFLAEGVSAGTLLWTTSGDVLPTGLTLSREGVLSGTTNEDGTYIFTVYAYVSNDVSAMKSVRLIVSTNAPIAIVTGNLPDGVVSEDYYAELDTRVYGVVWSIDEGTLPTGLTLNSNGVISGVPEKAGTFEFTVRAEVDERVGRKELTITITQTQPEKTREVTQVSASSGGGGCNVSTGRIMFLLIIPFMRRRKS